MKSRRKVIWACGIVVLLFTMLFVFLGYNNTWRLWNIPVLEPHFADLRTITHGAESYAKGFDPMVENPEDPWQRPLNYPRVWQVLYSFGINKSHTTIFGIIVVISFFLGVCLILPNCDNKTLLLTFAAVLSPASLLGVERGNIDLLVFFFAALSVAAIKRSGLLASICVLIGFALKLFPVLGLSILLREQKSKFLSYAFMAAVFVAIYVLLNYSDIVLVMEGTPQSTYLSYGLNVFWMHLTKSNITLGSYVKIFCYSAMVIIPLWFYYLIFYRKKTPLHTSFSTEYLDAFRVGATIYMGTFVIGNNWDYRLVFLIFTIPQMYIWIEAHAGRISIVSKLTMLAVFLSLWHLLMLKIFEYIPYGGIVAYVLDEAANWMVLFGLLFLFLWSLPSWHLQMTTTSKERVR